MCMDKKINEWMEGRTRDRETDRSMGVWMGWLCRRVKGRSLCIKRWMDGYIGARIKVINRTYVYAFVFLS